MAPLIQPTLNLIGLIFAAVAIALTATILAGLLVRQLRWFGFDAFDKEMGE